MWQVTAVCFGVLVGVTAAQWTGNVVGISWLIVAAGIGALAGISGRRWSLALMLLVGMMVGLWRGGLEQQGIAAYRTIYDKHVRLTGKVAEDPDTNKRNELVLKLTRVTLDSRSLVGEIWVTTANRGKIQRSDTVTVDGKLSPGFGSLAASIKNATVVSVQREQPGDIALELRNDFAAHIDHGIHDPAAALGEGYLLGQKRGLPNDLADALKIAGLTHVVVASGYNLTILVRLARRLFVRVSKFLSAFTSLTMIGIFMAITGLSPSMTRAGLVSVLALGAWYYGRNFHPVTLLAIAGAVTVLVNPSYAWGNLGWELSFAAFAGVMILAPLIHAYFFGNEKPSFIAQVLIETVSAQIATLPIILVAFGQLSNVAPVANLLIVPFVPIAMLLTFAAGIGAYILPAFAAVIAWPAQTLLDSMIAVIQWCANLSWAQVSWPLPWWGALLWYVLLAITCVYLWRVTGYPFHKSSIVE